MLQTLRSGALGLTFVVGLTVGAAAQSDRAPVLGADCFGVDHPPVENDPPPGDWNSLLVFWGSLRDAHPNAQGTLTVEDPSGALLTGTGTVDDRARIGIVIGITQFGEHTVRGPLTLSYEADGQPAEATIDSVVGRVVDVGPAEQPCTREEVPEGTLQAAATTTTAAPTTTAPATVPAAPSTVTTIVVGDETSGSFRTEFVVPIVIGGLVVLVGVYLYLRTRQRQRPGGVVGTGAGSGSLGRSPPATDDGRLHKECDWAAYYWDGRDRVPLRKATGVECCVYVVDLSTRVVTADLATGGRQDRSDGRFRVPDLGLDFAGLGVGGWASARSGPAGRLDWMQAEMPAPMHLPEGMTPNESYRAQRRGHEEPADVVAHNEYSEETTLSIEFMSQCPGHENTFDAHGTSTAIVQAGAECSNREPGPECPVELTSSSLSRVTVAGDLNYALDAAALSDTDELEGAVDASVREVGGVLLYGSHRDSHDHFAPVQTFERRLTGGGHEVTKRDHFTMGVAQTLLLDAGSIVPDRVHATTDVVSADAFVRFSHDIHVSADSQSCEADACCDGGGCACSPSIGVAFHDFDAAITVDGEAFRLQRPRAQPGAGIFSNWELWA